MILLLGGTSEARNLAAILRDHGFEFIVTVATGYGKKLAVQDGSQVETGPMGFEDMEVLGREKGITVVIDATHPFAAGVSINAMKAAEKLDIAYIRFERPGLVHPDHPLVKRAYGYEQAARMAVECGEIIFLAIGVRNLDPFLREAGLNGKDVVVLVLPLPSSLNACLAKGLQPSQIVAWQGPSGRELVRAVLKEYQADVIVTKESGIAGGTVNKVLAAIDLGIPVVVIDRPPLDYRGSVFCQEDDLVRHLASGSITINKQKKENCV